MVEFKSKIEISSGIVGEISLVVLGGLGDFGSFFIFFFLDWDVDVGMGFFRKGICIV